MKFIFVLVFVMGVSSRNLLPDWVSLDCDGNHQYFFSDQKLTWSEASDECNLYGGYLLRIDSLEEQNCLLKYGYLANLAGPWFWQDGILVMKTTNFTLHFSYNCWQSGSLET